MNDCHQISEEIRNRDIFRYYQGVKLKPLKRVEKGSKTTFSTFDVETKDGLKGKEIYCWKFCNPEKKRVGRRFESELKIYEGYESLDKMFEILLKWKDKTHPKIVFVHNLGFDVRFIVEYCAKHQINCFPISSGSNIIAYTIKDKEKGYNVRFQDSYQFLQQSQEKAELEWQIESKIKKHQTIALMKVLFENKKYKDGIKPFRLWTNNEKSELLKHCENDVIALWKIIHKFRNMMLEIGHTDILTVVSMSALAMKVFRRSIDYEIENPFLYIKKSENKERKRLEYKREIIPNQSNDKFKYKDEFVRESYFGGRTEVFDLSKHKLAIYLDRVSMYPSEMKNNPFPFGNGYFLGNHNDEHLNKIERRFLREILLGIHNCEGFIKCNVYPNESISKLPLLPEKRLNKTMFTNCVKIGKVYTIPELRKALEIGYEIECLQGLIYTKSKYIFENFVSKYYKIKQMSKGGRRKGAKLLLNGCYGKFGQAFERRSAIDKFFLNESEMLEYTYDIDSKFFTTYDNNAGVYICSEIVNNISMKAYMNVAIASYTTAYARINLFETIDKLMRENIPVYYCDTDSFTTSVKYYDKIVQIIDYGYDLGNWNIEQCFKEVKFLAPKCYISKQGLDYKLKLKGVDRKKIEEIQQNNTSLKSIENKIRKPIEIAEKYMKYRESLRSGKMINSKTLCKHYSFENSKRKFDKFGKSVAWNDENITTYLSKNIPIENSI